MRCQLSIPVGVTSVIGSFYAELQVEGRGYPVRHCSYHFTQATDERGRVSARVRHGLIQLTLDVPDDDFLLSWAAASHQPLPGQIVFYSARGGPAREILAWEAGNCVAYQEEFLSGSIEAVAYVCHLTIAAPKLRMLPGGPAAYVSPAAREHGSPQQGFGNPMLVPLLTPVAPVLETGAAGPGRSSGRRPIGAHRADAGSAIGKCHPGPDLGIPN